MKIFKIFINVCIDINAIKFSGNNFIEIIQKLYNKIFDNFKLCKKMMKFFSIRYFSVYFHFLINKHYKTEIFE